MENEIMDLNIKLANVVPTMDRLMRLFGYVPK